MIVDLLKSPAAYIADLYLSNFALFLVVILVLGIIGLVLAGIHNIVQ